jgi:protein-disulfide isomerase
MTLGSTLAAIALALAGCSKGADTAATAPTADTKPVAAVSAPAGQSWLETVSKTDEGGYRMGNPNAAVKLVEYGSRMCPTCGAFGREAYEPLKPYVESGKVSFEFRDYLVHGAMDLPAALVGQCGGPAPFFPILEQMYQNQASYLDWVNKLTPADKQALEAGTAPPMQAITTMANAMGMVDFVKQRGIPEAKARACLADKATVDRLTKFTQDATNDGSVTGTPTFFINGKTVPQVVTWAQLEPALKAAGA